MVAKQRHAASQRCSTQQTKARFGRGEQPEADIPQLQREGKIECLLRMHSTKKQMLRRLKAQLLIVSSSPSCFPHYRKHAEANAFCLNFAGKILPSGTRHQTINNLTPPNHNTSLAWTLLSAGGSQWSTHSGSPAVPFLGQPNRDIQAQRLAQEVHLPWQGGKEPHATQAS